MKITDVEFITSAVKEEHFPINDLPEVMLCGRSNVGKSSFINSMINRKNMAYISSRPGKTQTINFFRINNEMMFVDVPGYGYAKVSRKQREEFGKMIEEYITTRKQLKLAILLVDFRHNPSEDDILMYNFLKYYDIPTLVVGTKLDKVNKTARVKHERNIKTHIEFDSNDRFVRFSSETKEGKEDAWKTILYYIKNN